MFGIDKLYHLAAGALAALLAAIIMPHPLVALLGAVVAGVGKEVYDLTYNRITGTQAHTPDALDAIATVAGGVPVALLLLSPAVRDGFRQFMHAALTTVVGA